MEKSRLELSITELLFFICLCLILDSSESLSAGIQSAGDLVSETLGSNPAFSKGRQLVSF